ncbi:S41 family peptidase [Chitinophaga arvensicola]|uniref:Peptidase family S41 n=1 Tax=Chitinophaga arvensicola TaxID=29529 RepID=A0A1I0RJI0_9BACT|nr:S41 family peptidase [Chitinophaga arvensicola]SEW40904.1 Peptidase family S41 [Chitinophaga arvensicola]
MSYIHGLCVVLFLTLTGTLSAQYKWQPLTQNSSVTTIADGTLQLQLQKSDAPAVVILSNTFPALKGQHSLAVTFKIKLSGFKGRFSAESYPKDADSSTIYLGMLRYAGQSLPTKNEVWETRTITFASDATFNYRSYLLMGCKSVTYNIAFQGTGSVFLKDITLLVDGKPANFTDTLPVYPADKDHAFDHGSGFSSLPIADSLVLDHLTTLGKIWGFLKFYYPVVNTGNYQWDYELFRILPSVISAKNTVAANQVFLNWVQSYGPVPRTTPFLIDSTDVKQFPDLDWIRPELLGDSLALALRHIVYIKRPRSNYYITYNAALPDTTLLLYAHERSYPQMTYPNVPDAGFRYLTALRFWNQVQYFHAYRTLIPGYWGEELKTLIKRFVEAEDLSNLYAAHLQSYASLKTSHATLNVMDNPYLLQVYFAIFGSKHAPFRVRIIDQQAVVEKVFTLNKQLPDLQPGDIIEQINDMPFADYYSYFRSYIPASNTAATNRGIAEMLTGTNDNHINYRVNRNGHIFTVAITDFFEGEAGLEEYMNHLSRQEGLPGDYVSLKNNIVYINVANMSSQRDIFKKYAKNILGAKGVIIDLRGYSFDDALYDDTYFYPHRVPYWRQSHPDLTMPGLFRMNAGDSCGKENPDYYKGKLVVLVNERTQSKTESYAISLQQAPDVTVIGSTTAGADGCSLPPVSLPGNMQVFMEFSGIYYLPDGARTVQQTGIVPDIYIAPTIEGIKAGKDEQLEKAIEFLHNAPVKRPRT